MSYIKTAIVFDGIARIVEVHGATWMYLDVQAYGRGGAKYYRQFAADAQAKGGNPGFYLRIAEDFERTARNPYSTRSSLALDILKRGLSPIAKDNKREWFRFALEEDRPGNADNSGGPAAVMIDFDSDSLTDTPDNSFAEYRLYLPKGWTYRRITPRQMIATVEPRLARQDRTRLGSPEGRA